MLLTETIRIKNIELLKAIAIHGIGDKDAVREAVRVLKKTGKNAIAVRDADVGAAPSEALYSSLGKHPPEKEVFQHPEVKSLLKNKYGIDVDWIIQRDEIQDHHNYAKYLAAEAETEESVIRTIVIEGYIKEVDGEFDNLINSIERAVNS